MPAGEERGLFRLWLDGASVDVEAPFRGSYGAENVIAVAAVAHRLGMSIDEIASGFADAVLPRQRFSCSRAGNWLVIDDSYNANPLSFARMLESASEMAGDKVGKPFVCVLGEMGELGQVACEEHRTLGRRIAAARPRMVLWKGEYEEEVRAGLEAERFSGMFSEVSSEADMLQALERLSPEERRNGGVVLFKGSRLNRLETFVTAFLDAQSEDSNAL